MKNKERRIMDDTTRVIIILNSEFSILNSEFSIPNSQFSIPILGIP